MKLIYFFLFAAILAVLLGGCSADHGSALQQSKTSFTINWPARTRLVPEAASSISIMISHFGKSDNIATQTIDRPADGSASTVVFSALPLGQLTATATAYPQSAANGVALAVGSVNFVVTPGNVTSQALRMGSTITQLSLTPNIAALTTGSSYSFTPQAMDAAGDTVLLSLDKLSWTATNVAGASVSGTLVEIDPPNTVKGLQPGSVTLTVRDAESGLSASAQLTIANTPTVTVAINPTTLHLAAGQPFQFVATVTGDPNNQGVNWSVQEGATGGQVTAAGFYSAPIAAGTYHVTATSISDKTQSATATVIVSVAVNISPTVATLATNQTRIFTATVVGTTTATLHWHVQEGSAGGTISDPNPLQPDPLIKIYTAPPTPGTYHIVATSDVDPTQSATGTILVGTAQTYNALGQFGSMGTGNGQFMQPWGITVDAARNIYVTDAGNNRVEKFDSSYNYLASWNLPVGPGGQPAVPTGIIVNSNSGDVYVADSWNGIIYRFAEDGTPRANWTIATPGSGAGDFLRGLALDGDGNVYVVNAWSSCVAEFSANGVNLGGWGNPGSGNGQFLSPSGIAIDTFGHAYIADSLNSRIQSFTPTGAFQGKWGELGSASGEFSNPGGVAVDAVGNVYVADTLNNRVQAFTSNGAFMGSFGSMGAANGQFNNPVGIAIDMSGTIYVVDSGNNRIQTFRSQ